MKRQGFFRSQGTVRSLEPLVANCAACRLWEQCESPKMPVNGKGEKKILIVGEAPGKQEDEDGVPFVGPSGEELERLLELAGMDHMRRNCWITNSAICRPPRNIMKDQYIVHCRPNVMRAIRDLKPEVVILLGGSAVESVIGSLWKEHTGAVGRWIGWQIPSQRFNAWVCPTWHPSYLLRFARAKPVLWPLMEKFVVRDLKRAISLEGRPWKEPPNWRSRCKTVLDPELAAVEIKTMLNYGKPMAFDYETNMLKPDSSAARIICASVSDGHFSVSFPWQGAAVEMMREFVKGDIPKIGYNLSFENRWTKEVLGCWVRNWEHDGMLVAHVLDNRREVCSLEFQAFVRFGVDNWKAPVRAYLQARGGNVENRIGELDLSRVLEFNAIDSLLEYKVRTQQREEMTCSTQKP